MYNNHPLAAIITCEGVTGTNRTKVEICGVNTSKLTVLTDEEKKDLLERTKHGDIIAREKLIA